MSIDRNRARGWTAIVIAFLFARITTAADLSGGVMYAVPVPQGRVVQIDGKLDEWDRSAAEPCYIAPQTIDRMNAVWSLMYDDEALYVGVVVSLPDRPLSNRNKPQDPFWQGDLVQLRLAADPALAYPLNGDRDAANRRVVHISLWKDSETNEDFAQLTFGTHLDLGQVVNPPGTKVAIVANGDKRYMIEARIPWHALNVIDGRNPFAVGQRMTAVLETLWTGGDATRVAANYRANPGAFAFMQPQTWGQIEFARAGFKEPLRPTIAAIAGRLNPPKDSYGDSVGQAFNINVPSAGLKASVNIIGAHGEVIRELVGGEDVAAGAMTVKWDGRDQWGHIMPPGTYRWGALFHRGLKADYIGSVGTSGDPKYSTLDGRGGWGGDHSEPIDIAADASGYYFLWPIGEAGRPVVKTDVDGHVLWRKNPFVGGGFGPFYAIATDAAYVYLTLGGDKVRLVRLDAKTGELLKWGDTDVTELPIYEAPMLRLPADTTPATEQRTDPNPISDLSSPQQNAPGLAVSGRWIYVADYAQDKIVVLDKSTGKIDHELAIRRPRGLAVSNGGDVYAASFDPGALAAIFCFKSGEGVGQIVTAQGLDSPYGVAVGGDGKIFVSDLGASQQVKCVDNGKVVSAFGRKGGRAYQGSYWSDAFLHPAGITVDSRGSLLVAESSLPKVFDRIDLTSGKVGAQWFGPGAYWNSTWPMPDDPLSVFSTANGGIVRGAPAADGQAWIPEAYFAPDRIYPQVGNLEANMPQPEVVRANNGKTYLLREADPRAIYLFDPAGKSLRPIATFRAGHASGIDAWIDANGDGLVQPTEQTHIARLQDGSPMPVLAEMTGATHLEPNGDLYFVTQNNCVLKLPAADLRGDGTMRWKLDAISVAIPHVFPGQADMNSSWRHGILGVRLGRAGDFYTCLNTRVAGSTSSEFDYASPELANHMMEGMGHTATFNVVKFAKYDPAGKLLWMAGRKATAGAAPGEMYHFWNLAGLVGDGYVAGASEWGRIYFYTADGFYVDAIMNDPATNPPPGPATNGGETSGGRVQYFADRDEVWAYVNGNVFRVEGFKNGKLLGESRTEGQMQMNGSYASDPSQNESKPPTLQLTHTEHDLINQPADWANVPRSEIRRGKETLLAAQLAYDDTTLYARFEVTDSTPLENAADDAALAFKGGDSVSVVLGTGNPHAEPVAGDVRILAAKIKGKPTLVVMRQVVSADSKYKLRPFDYTTPAGGTSHFADVGELQSGRLTLEQIDTGYIATWAVPRAELGLPIDPKIPLAGDIELRLSGTGARGLQTIQRAYLFAPSTPETTMVDDVPTESRIFTKYFQSIQFSK